MGVSAVWWSVRKTRSRRSYIYFSWDKKNTSAVKKISIPRKHLRGPIVSQTVCWHDSNDFNLIVFAYFDLIHESSEWLHWSRRIVAMMMQGNMGIGRRIRNSLDISLRDTSAIVWGMNIQDQEVEILEFRAY
jgi:hypothetical protein